MFYNDIIFQAKVNENYYWGKFKINILDFGIFQYQNKDSEMCNYVEKWFNLTYSNFNKSSFECEIQIVMIKENIKNINKLHFDFIFDQETKIIKTLDKEVETEIYKTYYNKIHQQLNIDLEKDYDSDELEYKIDDNYLRDKVEKGFDKYLTKDGSVRKKYITEVEELESKYNVCLESALYKLYEEEELEKFNYMKEEEFIKSKIEDADKKLKVLEYLIENFNRFNDSLHEYCVKKYATQLCRKFKYNNEYLTKVRYNFVVTSFNTESRHECGEIKIDFESQTGKIKGNGSFEEGGNNKRGTYSNIYFDICNDDDNDNYEFDEDIGKELIDYITYEMRYIEK